MPACLHADLPAEQYAPTGARRRQTRQARMFIAGSRDAGRLMAPVKVDPDKVHEFEDAERFYDWLGKHHDTQDEVWIKIHKLGFGAQIDHAQGSHRRGALLGLDRRGAQGVRRQELSAALHAARQEEHLEPDQRRQRRPADRGGPDDRARAQAGRGGQGRRALGPRLRERQGHEDPRRSPGRHRRRAEGQGNARRNSASRTASRWPSAPTT